MPVYDNPEEPPTRRLEDKTWIDLAAEQGATNRAMQAKKMIQSCSQYYVQTINGGLEPKAHFESRFTGAQTIDPCGKSKITWAINLIIQMRTSAVKIPGVTHFIPQNTANGEEMVAPFKKSELWFYRVNRHKEEHDNKQIKAIGSAVETLSLGLQHKPENYRDCPWSELSQGTSVTCRWPCTTSQSAHRSQT